MRLQSPYLYKRPLYEFRRGGLNKAGTNALSHTAHTVGSVVYGHCGATKSANYSCSVAAWTEALALDDTKVHNQVWRLFMKHFAQARRNSLLVQCRAGMLFSDKLVYSWYCWTVVPTLPL